MLRLAAAALVSFLMLPAPAADFSAWKDSARIFINTSPTGANLAEPVPDFPLLVRLDSSNMEFSRLKAGAADLRFADPDRTPIPHELDECDLAARSCLVWVRVPVVDAGSTVDHVVMYWNNPSATAPSAGSVFDISLGYVATWHLGEGKDGIGSQSIHRDAAKGGHHGDDFASAAARPGVIGRAQGFDGKDDHIHVSHADALALAGPLTLSAWIRADEWTMNREGSTYWANPIIRKGGDNPNSYQLLIWNGRLVLSLDAGDSDGARGRTTLRADRFYHVAATWNTDRTLRLYVNGESDGEFVTPSPPPLSRDSRSVYLGGRADPSTGDYFKGDLDEVRISRQAQSPQHIKLSYENQKAGSAILTFQAFPKDTSRVEDLAKWPRSRRLFFNTTASGAGISGDVTAFPLLVRLAGSRFDFSQAAAGGRDLRFSDPDGALLPHAIERWDAGAGKAEVWVRVPRIDGDSRTDHVRMHWGMPDAADRQDAAAVFDTADGFAAAWTMGGGESGRGGGAVYPDRTAMGRHAQDFVSAASGEGMIGPAQSFAALDYLKVPSHPDLDFAREFTFSAWIKGESWFFDSSKVNVILRKGEENPNSYQLAVDDGFPNLFLDDVDHRGHRGRTRLDTGRWHHVAASLGPSGAMIYVDGREDLDSPIPRLQPLSVDVRPMYLGGRPHAQESQVVDHFHGYLDEIQVSRVARGSDWIRLVYETQKTHSVFLRHEGFPDPSDTSGIGPNRMSWTWDTVVTNGGRIGDDSLFSMENLGPGAVRIRILPSGDTLAAGITEVEAIIRLTSEGAASAQPLVRLAFHPGEAGSRSVYQLLPGADGHGVLRDLGPAIAPRELAVPGDYTVARDTSVPVLRYLEEGRSAGDSSWILFSAEDNLESVTIKGHVEGAEGAPTLFREERSGSNFRLSFKPLPGLSPLRIVLTVEDGRQSSTFPFGTGTAYAVIRSLPGLAAPIRSPAGLEWSLNGLSARPESQVTLGALGKSSGAGRLFAADWVADSLDPSEGEYRILGAEDTLPAGRGIWMAAEKAFNDLPVGAASSFSPSLSGKYPIALRTGWNLVTSPALEKLAWPVRHGDQPAYDLSPVKGLHRYIGDGEYVDADTLEPWKGYFVFSRADTVLELGAGLIAGQGIARPAARLAAAKEPFPERDPSRLGLIFEPAGPPTGGRIGGTSCLPAPLRLGAATYAADGPGVEDEPMPSAPGNRRGLAAARSGRRLRTDLLGYREGRIHAWKIAWMTVGPVDAAPARLRLASLRLPAGSALWAASSLGGPAVALDSGTVLELSGHAADTLVVWASSLGLWREGDPVPGLGLRPATLKASYAFGPRGGELSLALPEAARVRANIHRADGRRLAGLDRFLLAPGHHVLPLGGGEAYHGLVFLTLEVDAGQGPVRRVLKVPIP